MAQINTRSVVLLANATVTTNTVGSDIVLPNGVWQGAIVSVNVNTVSGTSPTLNVFLQNKLAQAATTDLVANPPTGTAIYDDLLSFTTMTTSNTIRVFRIYRSNASVEAANSDAALAAGTARNGPLGGLWRIKLGLGGTTPSFAINGICVEMIP